MKSLFEHVKDSVLISDFVRTLPETKGLRETGRRTWRCNNVISGGDNTSSMLLDDERGIFKVYSHGQESGDVIRLYSLTLGINQSQRDAAVGLARHMGIHVPEEMLSTRAYSPTADMLKAMDSLADLTHDYLVNSDNDDARTVREYLQERGASLHMISEWKLGMIPSGVNRALSFISEAGDKNIFKKTKIITDSRRGDFVPMAGRLTFPIFNPQGRCVSLSSRQVPGVPTPMEDSKYINTSNSPVYDKSETLYGSHLLKRKLSQIVICEGNFDVVALNYMLGDDSVAVATCGTALTESHVELIKKYRPDEVMIFFDNDAAGKESAAKSLWVVNHIANTGIHAPEGDTKDPWDVFMDGGDIDIRYQEPAVTTGARIMSKQKDREDFLGWFKDTYRKLNFREDREILIHSMRRFTGASNSTLNRMVVDLAPATSSRASTAGVTVSPQVQSTAIALLSMDVDQRKDVAFSLLSTATSDQVMDVCGVRTDDDRSAILAALGSRDDEKMSAYVSGLYPDPDEEEHHVLTTARSMARSLLSRWRSEGIPQRMSGYVPAVNMISSGTSDANAVDQLGFIFDMAAAR